VVEIHFLEDPRPGKRLLTVLTLDEKPPGPISETLRPTAKLGAQNLELAACESPAVARAGPGSATSRALTSISLRGLALHEAPPSRARVWERPPIIPPAPGPFGGRIAERAGALHHLMAILFFFSGEPTHLTANPRYWGVPARICLQDIDYPLNSAIMHIDVENDAGPH